MNGGEYTTAVNPLLYNTGIALEGDTTESRDPVNQEWCVVADLPAGNPYDHLLLRRQFLWNRHENQWTVFKTPPGETPLSALDERGWFRNSSIKVSVCDEHGTSHADFFIPDLTSAASLMSAFGIGCRDVIFSGLKAAVARSHGFNVCLRDLALILLDSGFYHPLFTDMWALIDKCGDPGGLSLEELSPALVNTGEIGFHERLNRLHHGTWRRKYSAGWARLYPYSLCSLKNERLDTVLRHLQDAKTLQLRLSANPLSDTDIRWLGVMETLELEETIP
jgi:hypothetical protein